jgi:hypothetical protein
MCRNYRAPYFRGWAAQLFFFLVLSLAGDRWLTPVILATQEAEIRGLEVRSQPGQILPNTQHKKRADRVAQVPAYHA